jgi:hypothetical protein
MHSPAGLEPVSPSPSTPSSGSPPPELEPDALADAIDESTIQPTSTATAAAGTSTPSSAGGLLLPLGTPKRPLPSSGLGGNTKSKRKMDHLRSTGSGFGGHPHGGGFGRRSLWGERDYGIGMGMGMGISGMMGMGISMRESGRKEELLDVSYTEKLKKCESS